MSRERRVSPHGYVLEEPSDGVWGGDHKSVYPTPRAGGVLGEGDASEAALEARVRQVQRELLGHALTGEPREVLGGYLGHEGVRVDGSGLREVLGGVGRVRPETFSVLQLKPMDRGEEGLLLPRVDGWGVEWLGGGVVVQWTWAMETLHEYGDREELEEACDGEGDGAFVLCPHDDVWGRGCQAAQLDRLEGVQWATLVSGRLREAEWGGEAGAWVPVNARPLPWIEKLGDGAWHGFLCGYLDMVAAIDRAAGW